MLRFLSTIWDRWLKIAEILGNIQLAILLSLIYWTIFLLIAIPAKLFSDPLSIRSANRSRWVRRETIPDALKNLRKQG